MYSHFVLYGFCSREEDQISNGTTPYVAYPILSIPCPPMPWWLEEPRHQQAWYWSPNPEYSDSSIWRVKTNDPKIIEDNFNDFYSKIVMSLSKHMAQTTKKSYQFFKWHYLSLVQLFVHKWIRGKKDCKCAQNQNMIRSWWDISKAPEI